MGVGNLPAASELFVGVDGVIALPAQYFNLA
jgi:hypothetical protein